MKGGGWGVFVLGLCGSLFGEALPVTVHMLNGDVFSGVFHALDSAGTVQVQPAWEDGLLRFHAAYTGRLRFDRVAPARGGIIPDTRFHFVNGDRISGRLVSLSDSDAVLDTGWGSRLRANRDFIERLDMLPGEEGTIFRGMVPRTDWSLRLPPDGGGALTEKVLEGRVPGDARISRRLPLPEAGGVLLEMDVSFPDGNANLYLDLFQSSRDNRLVEGMSLSVNLNWLHLRTVDGNGRQNWVMREPLPPEAAGEWLRIAVHLNLETAEVTLRINGVLFPSFTLHTERPLPGRSDLEFVLQTGRDTGGVTLHTLAFSQRKAVLPPDVTVFEASTDGVVFMNGDHMAARVLSMEPQTLRLELNGGQEVRVPRERVHAVWLNGGGGWFPRRRDRDVQVDLTEWGDRLTLALQAIDSGRLTGESEMWMHPPEMPAEVLREVRFNLYQGVRFDDAPRQPPFFLFER